MPDWSNSDQSSNSDSEEGEEVKVLYTPNLARQRVGAPRVRTPKLCDFITTPDIKSKLKRLGRFLYLRAIIHYTLLITYFSYNVHKYN